MTPQTFLSVLTWLREEVDPQLNMDMLTAFLFIAQRSADQGYCTQNELEESLFFTNSSSSRNVAYWSHRRFDKKPGMDFIRREIDPDDMRYRRLSLTPKGRTFFAKLQEKIR